MKVISFLRFPLCVIVVLIHTAITIDNNWLQISLSHVLSQVAVPSFFFFSGYLFFLNFNIFTFKGFVAKLRRRFYSLLIPYVLWISIWILIKSFFVWSIHGSILDYFQLHSWLDIWHLYWDSSYFMVDNYDWLGNPAYMTAPYLVPLWYLRDLMVVCTMSPFIYYAIKKNSFFFVAFLGIAYMTHIWPIHTGLTIIALFWFSLGAFFSINKIDYVTTISSIGKYSYLPTLFFFIVEMYYDGSHTPIGFIIHPFYVISMFVTLICFSAMIVDKCKPNDCLSKSSFFVYISHGVFISYVTLFVNHLIPSSSYLQLMVKYFLVPTITICISLCIYMFISSHSKLLLKVLSGNR